MVPRPSGTTASGQTSRYAVAAWAGVAVLLAMTPGRTEGIPTLFILPLEMTDTSGETPSRAKEHEDRLAALTRFVSNQLVAHRLYSTVDPTPIDGAIGRARAAQPLDQCNGCELDLARMVHADRVLVGAVDKVSTLIGSLRLTIVDVATGRSLFGRTLGFRGDTDEAWQHAVRFFIRDLEATAALQR
jgi:Protein of unknown function (DUF2380)